MALLVVSEHCARHFYTIYFLLLSISCSVLVDVWMHNNAVRQSIGHAIYYSSNTFRTKYSYSISMHAAQRSKSNPYSRWLVFVTRTHIHVKFNRKTLLFQPVCERATLKWFFFWFFSSCVVLVLVHVVSIGDQLHVDFEIQNHCEIEEPNFRHCPWARHNSYAFCDTIRCKRQRLDGKIIILNIQNACAYADRRLCYDNLMRVRLCVCSSTECVSVLFLLLLLMPPPLMPLLRTYMYIGAQCVVCAQTRMHTEYFCRCSPKYSYNTAAMCMYFLSKMR